MNDADVTLSRKDARELIDLLLFDNRFEKLTDALDEAQGATADDNEPQSLTIKIQPGAL